MSTERSLLCRRCLRLAEATTKAATAPLAAKVFTSTFFGLVVQVDSFDFGLGSFLWRLRQLCRGDLLFYRRRRRRRLQSLVVIDNDNFGQCHLVACRLRGQPLLFLLGERPIQSFGHILGDARLAQRYSIGIGTSNRGGW